MSRFDREMHRTARKELVQVSSAPGGKHCCATTSGMSEKFDPVGFLRTNFDYESDLVKYLVLSLVFGK